MVIKPAAPIVGLEQAAAIINLIRDLSAYEAKISELRSAYESASEEIAKLNALYPGVDLINKATERAAVISQIAADKLSEAQKTFDEAVVKLDEAKKTSDAVNQKLALAEKRESDASAQAKSVSDAAAKLAVDRAKFEEYKRQEIETIMTQKLEVQVKIDAAKALLG